MILNCDKDDIVIFYYCGNGKLPDTTIYYTKHMGLLVAIYCIKNEKICHIIKNIVIEIIL